MSDKEQEDCICSNGFGMNLSCPVHSRVSPSATPDKCEFCLGVKGGVRGNENVIAGHIVCDYCTVLLMDVQREARRDAALVEDIALNGDTRGMSL